MLKKKLRVSKQVFKEAFKKGRFLSSLYLSLRFFRENSLQSSKFSFTVPKSVSKKAITRNLLKRRGYSAVKKLKNINNSYVLIFSFKKGGEKASFSELETEIENLLKKAKIIDF